MGLMGLAVRGTQILVCCSNGDYRVKRSLGTPLHPLSGLVGEMTSLSLAKRPSLIFIPFSKLLFAHKLQGEIGD